MDRDPERKNRKCIQAIHEINLVPKDFCIEGTATYKKQQVRM